MRNALHTRGLYVWALTAVSWVQSLKPWRWSSVCLPRLGSVLSGARTPLHALSPLIQTHTCSHTIYSLAHTPGEAHFPCFCLRGSSNGLEQACFWSGSNFGQAWRWPPFDPPTPEGGNGLGPLLNLHLLGELHFRYIVQALLHIADRRQSVPFKSIRSDQSFSRAKFWGWPRFLDHTEWTANSYGSTHGRSRREHILVPPSRLLGCLAYCTFIWFLHHHDEMSDKSGILLWSFFP